MSTAIAGVSPRSTTCLSSSSISQNSGTADILHESNFDFRNFGRRNKGRVSSFYDMMSEALAPHELVRFKKEKTAELSDRIVAISESTKSDMVHYLGTKPEKIEVIYLASDITPPSQRPSTVPNRPYVLWVGNRMSYKNFDTFVSALSRSKRFQSDLQLVCAGGPPLGLDEFEKLEANQIPRSKVSHFQPDENELAAMYQNAVALLYPSRYEGFRTSGSRSHDMRMPRRRVKHDFDS